ncbi:MAG TPA: hypothetical protein VKB46_06995, partial [Pyrinomonadaceae bacterium]|nr:hypothetical protein [Pyrinomonadaceae bacterium]
AFKVNSGMIDLSQLLLLAIERAVAPPVVHQRSVFQPMRIVVVDPTLFAPASADEVPVELPQVLPRALPSANHAAVHHRAVRGEILSDEAGRLYEKVGRQIRPIHQLASGRFGEVIDVVPVAPTAPRTIPTPVAPQPGEPANNNRPNANAEAKLDSEKSAPEATSVGHRKLFADPGQWRVLWWGDFKEILARQLAHPERLRDTYKIPCYVQVLETERTVSIQELAGVYKSDSKANSPLYLLTDEIAAKLDLVLPLRPAPPKQARREPHTLLAHERVFRLVVANDPTIDVTMLQSKAPTTGNVGHAASGNSLKETIPARFVNEWEFRFTREEVLYDLNARVSLASLIKRKCRKLRVIKRGREFHKWQTLLAGRNPDEQLWSVRPPAIMFADSLLREWASKTLNLAGYDTQKMLIEWEIFWRRKGL